MAFFDRPQTEVFVAYRTGPAEGQFVRVVFCLPYTMITSLNIDHFFVFVYLDANIEGTETEALSSFCDAGDHYKRWEGYVRLQAGMGVILSNQT